MIVVLPEGSALAAIGSWVTFVCAVALMALFIRSLVRSQALRMHRVGLAVLGVVAVLLLAFLVNRFVVPQDKQTIEATIEAVATEADPTVCRTKMTPAYLERLSGAPSPAADEVCEEEIASSPPHGVTIDQIEVDGDIATALVTDHGGSFDGSRREVRLVKEGGRWLLDRLLGFTYFDRPAFELAYRRSFPEFGSPPESAECALDWVSGLSDAELEAAIVSDGRRPFVRIFVNCDRGGAERSVIEGSAAPEYGLTDAAIACIRRDARQRDAAGLVQLLEDPLVYGKLLYRCGGEEILDRFEDELRADGDLEPETIDCVMRAFRTGSTVNVVRLTYDQAAYSALVERCD